MAHNVADILRSNLNTLSDCIALELDNKHSITYEELDNDTSRLANVLLAKNLRKGDVVSIAFTNHAAYYYIVAYFAIHKAGGIVVPVNPRYTLVEFQKQLDHSKSRFLLIEKTLHNTWNNANYSNVTVLNEVTIKQSMPSVSSNDPKLPCTKDDIAEIIYTSGTTGLPKAVVVTHESLTTFNTTALKSFLQKKRFLHPLPLHTFAGNTYMLFCIRVGMTNVLMSSFDPKQFIDILETRNIFLTYAVSTMWLLILKTVPNIKQRNFDHVRMIYFGAAPMPSSAVLELCDIFPKAVVSNVYGLTEMGVGGCMLPPGQARHHPDSVGQPLPNTEIRIENDQGNALSCGQTGEIFMRLRDTKPRHYLNDLQATQQIWSKDSWLRTGDIGYLDEDNYLYLIDRKKDVIIRGGHNIASVEIEEVLFRHSKIKEAAVVGIYHPELTEDIAAYIVPIHGESLSEDEINNFLLPLLSDYKRPRHYFFVDELPKNPMGKVLKRTLRNQAESKHHAL